jgi:hypothetical protein
VQPFEPRSRESDGRMGNLDVKVILKRHDWNGHAKQLQDRHGVSLPRGPRFVLDKRTVFRSIKDVSKRAGCRLLNSWGDLLLAAKGPLSHRFFFSFLFLFFSFLSNMLSPSYV